MALIREQNAILVGQFAVPFRGTWNSLAVHQLSPDMLYDSMNVYIREGKLRNRPGLTLLNDTFFRGKVTGGAMAVTPQEKVLLALTHDRLYTLTDSDVIWNEDSLVSITQEIDDSVDITFIETSSKYVAIIAAPLYPLRKWIQGEGVTAIAQNGTIPAPTAISVCSTARRIIALVEPHTVMWTSTLTYDQWYTLSQNKIAQTNDKGICVRGLTNLSFVVYKERSIYIARAQAASDAFAFVFSEPIIVEGPANVHSVIVTPLGHIYMSRSGRVALFTGAGYPQWIADGLWFFLQNDIDPEHTDKIFAIFDMRLYIVIFFYPKIGDNGDVRGMLIVNLPLEGSNVVGYSYFLGQTMLPVSYGYEMRFNSTIDKSVIFVKYNNAWQSAVLDLDSQDDLGIPFTCSFQTPLLALPDSHYYAITLEHYIERADRYGIVNMQSVTSNMLNNKSGNLSDEIKIIDLNSDPVAEFVGFNETMRFFGLRYSWQSDSMVKYAGVSVYGRVLS